METGRVIEEAAVYQKLENIKKFIIISTRNINKAPGRRSIFC